jgi:hypothetical protein
VAVRQRILDFPARLFLRPQPPGLMKPQPTVCARLLTRLQQRVQLQGLLLAGIPTLPASVRILPPPASRSLAHHRYPPNCLSPGNITWPERAPVPPVTLLPLVGSNRGPSLRPGFSLRWRAEGILPASSRWLARSKPWCRRWIKVGNRLTLCILMCDEEWLRDERPCRAESTCVSRGLGPMTTSPQAEG